MTGLVMQGLAFLGRHATSVLFIGVFLGLAWPDLAALLRPLFAATVALLLFATLLRMDWPGLSRYARQPGLIVIIVLWLLAGSSLLVLALVRLSPLPESLDTALVLMAASPPILSAAALAILLRLDAPLALVAILVSTLLVPLTLPPLALALLGLRLDIGLIDFMLRLGLLIGGAFVAALIVRRWLGTRRLAEMAVPLDGSIVLIMLIFAIAIMDGVTARLIDEPGKVALWIAAAFVANPLLQLAGALAFAWLGRSRALTIGLMSGNCNMGLLLATLPATGNSDVLLFFALAQLPIYMLPALLRPIYRRAAA